MTLRRRVFGYVVLAVIASCALTVGVAVVLVRHRISAQRMSRLEAQADVVAAVGGAPGALTPGDHVYRIGAGRPRLVSPARQAAVLAAIPTGNGQGSATVDKRPILYVARSSFQGRIILVTSAALAFAEWRPFLVALVLAGAGGALLALLLSYLLARRLTGPIAALSTATGRLASGGRDVAVPVEGDDELAQLGTAFNEMASQLTQAQESQRRFLESVSHELKTPLTSIRGYAEALEEEVIAPGDGARVIEAEAGRLERLVSDLLDLARFGRSGFSVERETVELGIVAREAIERHLPRAHDLGVELSSSIAEDAWAIADQDRVLQATSNLIENALRLTPPGGSVTVAVAGGSISVRDTGPGLAQEDIPRAFERFYLHSRYRSERPVGTGLGLAIVSALVAAMGGTVEASAPPTGGAVFVIRLPTPARSALPGAAQPSA